MQDHSRKVFESMETSRMQDSDRKSTDAVIFVGISLLLGIASRHVLRNTRVPYTVALLVLGIGLGALERGTNHGLGRIGAGIRIWSAIDPDLLLAIFLPALLFESSFSMEIHQIKRCIMQMFLLAGPGVLISTFFLGAAVKLAFPYGWDWKTSLLFGGLLSATDPVAVVALLRELGASKKLSTIIEGESLMNDGTAIVVYQLFYHMVTGWRFDWGTLIKFLSQVSLGAIGIGLAFGIASVLWLGFIFNDTVIEITLTLAVSYIAFFTSQEGLDISGVLTVMTLGMEMVAYIANTLIFILSGVVIAESFFSSGNIYTTRANSWGYLLLLYLFVQVSRVVVVCALFPLLRYFGYGLDWKEAVILIWSGLRGAVALSLSLTVKRSSGKSLYNPDTGDLFVFLTGGIVFLTLIINGSTTQFVLQLLKMDKLSAAKKRILSYTKYEMLNRALQAFSVLGDDDELGPAEWPIVKRYIKSLNDADGGLTLPESSSENDADLDHLNLKDMRVRLLNGVQAAYWEMLEEGRITQVMANLLMRSVDEAMDLVSRDSLCDWKGLNSYVTIPNHYKFLQSGFIPQKLVTYFTVERLESGCCICAAFLRAHRIARQQLQDFIGDNEVTKTVIAESEQEGVQPKKFLEDVRINFPQVLHVVKTRQVAFCVLNHLIDYVHNLEKIGLLEKKEMTHLHDAVQTDLKRLMRNPPIVNMPKARDLMAANPFLGALPYAVRESLAESTKKIVKLSGTTLYREESKPSGIWLISNGVVKWSSKSMSNSHPLNTTFSHGSTLGLYEVLSGKSYVCDVIVDTLVMCFFLDTDSIHSVCKSDAALEEFFWQESVIALAKLMLPHIFEKMTMQDLRSLIAERSTMNIYISGESFELHNHCIGFLLEGFIALQGGLEEGGLLTAPAAVLPRFDHRTFPQSRTTSANNKGTSHLPQLYHVETRSRIMTIDFSGWDAGRSLNNRHCSSSHSAGDRLLSDSHHGGLMCWPQQVSKSKCDLESWDDANNEKNNLSTRAMQLSIYGSMVEKSRRHFRRPAVSVKSEDSTTLRKKLLLPPRGSEPNVPLPPRSPPPGPQLQPRRRDLSDDSDSEDDEHVVRIDSPSRLSFQHVS